ncbi:unnamed protein product [Rotaria sordida]|uniref:Uncharacterized protein n=1 Tax=Rotaria sordida TaxID=392033 RepID=A0A814Y996_9BILA|nr:unnamed protein product [Rotaria sordida]
MGQTYILVVTTHISSEIGSFSVSADGPGSVGLTSITPSTSQPIITLSTAPPMSSSFAGALSSSSPIFYRPNISATGPASAGLISITPSTSQPITTISTASSVSSSYAGALSSTSPVFYRPYGDTDVTTHSDYETASFSISAIGPASVGLMSITPSTSRPIVTLSTAPSVSSSYAGTLSSSSPVFIRPDSWLDDYSYFQAIQVTISTTGMYTFISDSVMDTVGYIYDTPFDPSNPLANLITDDDDSGDSVYQFHIDVNLQSGRTYILVVTTHWEYTRGDYSISVTGPASVGLMSITPSTSRPIVTPSTAPTVSSSYSSTLSANSPIFYRPYGASDAYYYFQAIQITVPTTGIYMFTSNSDIDTRAYFYETSFDPSDPLINLITDDDDSGDIDYQFRLDVNLQSGRTYILVVTTHGRYTTGSFSVLAVGPASVGLQSITPSTSRPITTPSTAPIATSSYAGALSASSSIFYRPEGDVQNQYYFQAIQITISTAGVYTFTSDISAVGPTSVNLQSITPSTSRPIIPPTSAPSVSSSYTGVLTTTSPIFYRPAISATGPVSISLTSITPSTSRPITTLSTPPSVSSSYANMLSTSSPVFYRPAVTTHRESVTGSFLVSATGPASISLTSITPSTSRPITTPSTPPSVSSSYASVLSTTSPIFYRPYGMTSKYYYFKAIQVTASTAGIYVFKSNNTMDTRAYFYQNSFDPSDPTVNLVTDNDDGGGYPNFRIEAKLESGRTYILVVTTHRESVIGSFSVSATGPASISFTSITPSTSRPITTLSTPAPMSSSYATSTTPSMLSSYASVLSSSSPVFYRPGVLTTYPSTLRASSPVFYRPNGEKTDLYYYQTIQVTVPKDGTYSFASVSDISTIGYLYDTSFDPFNPSSNLAIYSDNGGVRRGFRINFLLAPGRTYILVVTTSQTSVMGDFWILARGPALVSLRSIPSTGLTTTTSSPTTSANNPLTVATSPRGSASIKTNSITITVICMLIMSMLRMLQQRLF